MDTTDLHLSTGLLLNGAGILISLGAYYIPKLREWFAAKGESEKATAMLIAITLAALIAAGLNYGGIVSLLPEGKEGVILLVGYWLSALISNQQTYQISKKVIPVGSVEEIKKSQAQNG